MSRSSLRAIKQDNKCGVDSRPLSVYLQNITSSMPSMIVDVDRIFLLNVNGFVLSKVSMAMVSNESVISKIDLYIEEMKRI